MTRPPPEPAQPPALVRVGISAEASKWIIVAVESVSVSARFKTDPGAAADRHVAEHMSFLTANQMTITSAAILHACMQDTDSTADMSEDTMLLLQQAMERKAELETMISNVMKAAAETADVLANNLKS